jgi:hypothetical protein
VAGGPRGWRTTERVLGDGAFESCQRVVFSEARVEASETGARWLGVTYWKAVEAVTRGGVRASWTGEGGRLRLLGGAVLFRFGRPELAVGDGDVSCRYAIEGGLLALRAGGWVTLRQRSSDGEHEVRVEVEGYLPRLAPRAGSPPWAGILYVKGQKPFHAAVSRRYFELLEREPPR